jgi:phage shock protein PspC (stress-responsive transcriptional regulator)
MLTQRLYRSRSDRMIAGICGGIAHYFAVDSTIVRLFTVLATIFSGGVVALLYAVLWIVVPEDSIGADTMARTEAKVGATGESPSFGSSSPFESAFPSSGFGSGSVSTEEQRQRRSQWIGWALLALGMLILFTNLHLFSRIEWKMVWPALLILGGVYLLARHRQTS